MALYSFGENNTPIFAQLLLLLAAGKRKIGLVISTELAVGTVELTITGAVTGNGAQRFYFTGQTGSFDLDLGEYEASASGPAFANFQAYPTGSFAGKFYVSIVDKG